MYKVFSTVFGLTGERMKSVLRVNRWAAVALLAVVLAGCSMTKVHREHSLVQAAAGGGGARVYFLRPETERRMGFPDNPVQLGLNDEPLMELARGEYTVVSLVPREYTLTVSNQTEAGSYWEVKTLSRNYSFEFSAGSTYFIVLRVVDGEFRGVHFVAEAVDIADAQRLASRLRAVSVSADQQIERIPLTKG